MAVEPISVQPSPENPTMDDRDEHIMSNLKASLFAIINPSKTLTPQFKTYIEQRLQGFFPSFDTPSHPPYSSMIQRAIQESNVKEGLSREAISTFLKREYKDLPWGHESFLSHHLEKLCRNGDIACVNHQLYVLLDKDCVSAKMMGSTRKRKRRLGRRRRNQVTAKKMHKQNQQEMIEIEVFEETTRRDSQKLQVKMTEKENEAPVQPETGDQNPENFIPPNNSYNSIMSELKDSVLKELIAANPSKTISPEYKSCIEQQLHEFFCNLNTSTHPSYASDMCMKSVRKTKEFKELLLEFSDSLQGTESKYDHCGYRTEAKRKEFQRKGQQVQTQPPCVEMKSNIEVIEGQKQHQKQEEKVTTGRSQPQELVSERCGVKLRITWRTTSLPAVEEEKQEKQLQLSRCEQRELVLARKHHQPKISGQKMAAKSHSIELQRDSQQHLDLSAMKISPESKTDVNKSSAISPADPWPQYEQQPPLKYYTRNLLRRKNSRSSTSDDTANSYCCG